MNRGDWFVYNRKNPIDSWFNSAYEYNSIKIRNGYKILLCSIDTIRHSADFLRDVTHYDTHFEVKNHVEIYVSYYTFESESELIPVPDGNIPKVFSTKFDDFSLELFEKNFTRIPSIMGFDPTRSIRMIKIITSNILE